MLSSLLSHSRLTRASKYILTLPMLLGLVFTSQAQASLLISPVRVVMDDSTRSAEVSLLNTTQVTNRYRIEWIEYRQDQNDRYVIDTNNRRPASRMLSYSPRMVTLAPGKMQKIRLRYRPSTVEEGEYRSHLRMTALAPDSDELRKDKDNSDKNAKLAINVQLSFDLPIIVRKGSGDVQVDIEKIKLLPAVSAHKNSTAKMLVTFNHQGTFSSSGRVEILMQPQRGAAISQIGLLNNVNVFPDVDTINKVIPLKVKDIPAGAALKVVYSGLNEHQGRIFAEKTFAHKPQ